MDRTTIRTTIRTTTRTATRTTTSVTTALTRMTSLLHSTLLIFQLRSLSLSLSLSRPRAPHTRSAARARVALRIFQQREHRGPPPLRTLSSSGATSSSSLSRDRVGRRAEGREVAGRTGAIRGYGASKALSQVSFASSKAALSFIGCIRCASRQLGEAR
jgi:hypothetical protein